MVFYDFPMVSIGFTKARNQTPGRPGVPAEARRARQRQVCAIGNSDDLVGLMEI